MTDDEIDHGSLLGLRSRWTVALGTRPRSEVLELAEEFAERYGARHRAVPAAGLAMMKLRDSVLGQHYNLGEISLATARVELTSPEGERVAGAAAVMADDAQLAAALAVCDAVLAKPLDGWQAIARLVLQGLEELEEVARVRDAIVSRSKVDFSLLNQS